jgi:hypothetical protein
MNKLTRIMVMGGLGLLAALTAGAGPAQAASGVPESKSTVGQAQWRDGDEIVGFYQTPQACELAGQFGERSNNWDDHDCSYERLGLRRGAWALRVTSDDDWDRLGFGVPFRAIVGFPNQFRPVWPGQFQPGHPGHFRPGHPGHFRPGHSDRTHPGHQGPVRSDQHGPQGGGSQNQHGGADHAQPGTHQGQ